MNASIIEDNIANLPQDEILHLEIHVHRRLGSRLRGFRIRLQEAGLILEGFVATYYAKQLAQHAVMEATGVPILANEIEVR